MFDFVHESRYKDILDRDYNEVLKCLEVGAFKSVVVMSGSIIESVFIEYFINNLPQNKTKSQVSKLPLAGLIELAEEVGLISDKIKNLSSVIRDYRNYVHPAKEVRTEEFIDEETANIAFSLLKLTLKSINKKQSTLYGKTADQLFKKIQSDKSVLPIFDKLLDKLNEHEKGKLLRLFVDGYIDEYLSYSGNSDYPYIRTDREFAIKCLSMLKPKVDEVYIQEHLKQLEGEVEHGAPMRAVVLFDFFGEYLHLVGEETKEVILDYIYSVISINSDYGHEDVNLVLLDEKDLYVHLRLHNSIEKYQSKYNNIILSLIRDAINCHNKGYYFGLYKKMVLEVDNEKLDDFLQQNLTTDEYDRFFGNNNVEVDVDDLPF